MQYTHRETSNGPQPDRECVFPGRATIKVTTLIDRRMARHEDYADSLPSHKRIEDAFRWAKTIGGLTKLEGSGRAGTEAALTFRMIAYDLIRLPKPLDMTT